LPVSQSRVLPTLAAAAAVLVAALLLAWLPANAQANPFCTHTRMNIVAHQDDDLIFQNPDLLEAIAAGDCVRTVYVTAGDAGLGEPYWREREEGARAAYAVMAGVANSWTKSEATVAGHTLHLATLTGKPTVSQVYLRLPNGGSSGAGYAATGFKSLPKLWRSKNPEPASLTPITELSALDGSATYNYEGLLGTLEALIAEFEPEVISTQNFTVEFGTGDHADHITVAKLTRIAANAWTTTHVLRSYMDYETKNSPINVFEPQLAKKLSAYYAYATHDSNEACASQAKCEEPFYSDYWAWLHRQIVVSETSVPGANAGPDQAVASKAAVTLDGSGSSDPLGHALSYEWKQTGGTTVTLSNSKAVKPTFTAPTGPASLTFSLVVKSSEASSKADSVAVSVAGPKFTLKVTRSGNGSGTVTSSPVGIECGSDCEEAFEQSTKVTLAPSPAAGSEFKGWSGACSGTGACEVTMSAAKTVGAEFALQRHQLSISKSGTGSGTVASSPSGIECGATCSANYDHGTLVKLTGTPTAGSKAVSWSGCDAVNGSNQCEVTISAAKAVTATFNLETHQLSVVKNGTGTGTITSSPAGISCGSECVASFNHGTLVKLTGAPGANSKAVVWTTCPGTVNASNQCEVTMSAAKEAVATFNLEQRQLTVAKNGSGAGTVTSSPAGISCGSECVAGFNHGTLVTLAGTPGANSKAVVWQTCPGTVNASNQCEVTMSAAKEAVATFNLEQRQLTVERKGNGSGTVASSPAGINCGSECAASYDHGTLVKLTGAPAAGTKAVVWSGCDKVNGSNECEVTMSAAKKVEATFTLETHLLSVERKGSGSGAVTSTPAGIECGAVCSAGFNHGTKVTLTPSPAAGSEFKGWSGACSGSGACEVTMSAAKSVGAEFALQRHQLSISKSGTGSGTVTSAPAGIECGSECSASYDHGTLVTLSGAPGANSKAVVWQTCPGTVNASNQCEVTMSAAKEAVATFNLEQRQLTVAKNGSGAGTVTSSPAGISCGSECVAGFDHGTLVKLTGSPGANAKAVVWESCPGTVNASNQCEVTMSAAKEAVATFNLEQRQLTVAKIGSGAGTVTSSPAGIECGATCAAGFDHGTLVKLSGAPGANSKAVVWTTCPGTVNASNQCEVTMSAAKEAKATFNLEQRQLTAEKKGNGSGTVTSSPAGIECGATCAAGFDHGTLVKLSGAPTAGSKAVTWSGCDAVNASNQCEVTMGAMKKVEATFTLETHLLTVAKNGSGTGTVTSSPAGIECGSECSASYDHGTLVTLSGAPGANSKAVVWQTCPGTVNASNQCEVTMSAAKEAVATFNLEQRQLTVAKNGSGAGTVTSSPAGISCGSECVAGFDHGTLVKLTGTPGANTKAVAWQTCPGTVNASNQCEVTMSAAKEAVATFNLEQRQLTVSKIGSGTGTVTSSPAGINCDSECTANYDHGTMVKLTGTPGANTKAVAWQACPGTINASNQCEVTMSAAKEAVASFNLEQRQLTVAKNGLGTGTLTSSPAGIECGSECSASYDHGTLVTLTGTPGANTKAVVWESCPGTVNASNQCEVTMGAAKEAKATFNLEQRQLTVEKNGNGSGTITSSPAGIECGATCAANYDHGTLVKLSGAPAGGSTAVTWSGCNKVNGANECEVTMSAAKKVDAIFTLETHLLSVEKKGNGSGTVTSSPAGIECGATCAAGFDHGALVKLSGAPAAGSKAVTWSGCDAVNGADECEVTVSVAKEVEATFTLETHLLTVAENGSGAGTVTSSPAGISCGSECEAGFDHGTLVTLTGTPSENTKAVVWEPCPGTINASNQCEVTISAAKEAKATFNLEQRQLTIEKKGSGSGTVTSSPAGINCGSECSASYEHGTTVKLVGDPDAESKAVIWSGCDAIVGSNECEVAMTEVKAVAAKFDPVGTFTLTVKEVGNGAGTVASSVSGINCGSSCEAAFTEGTEVKLASSSATGSKAVEWSGCDAVAGGECEVTMSAAKEVTATYTLETHSLKIVKTGTGQGAVSASPAGIECGAICEAAFDYGTEVTLTAVPASTETVAWSGCDEVVNGNQCIVSMDADKEVSAVLDRVIPTPEEPPTPNPTPTPPPPETPSTKLLKAKVEHKRGTARFVFAARGSATSFRCALATARQRQKLKYKPCTSPTTYRNLAPGTYIFKVKAIGPGGAAGTPATRKFKVRTS
jgi:LmbE family N-acetylglucosaminyl deacetylase